MPAVSSDRDRWFRNEEWNSEIAEAFQQRLARARRKAQYLRIQAYYLIESHPKAALELLEQYFETGDQFEVNLAYLHKGAALTNLGDTAGAVIAYEDALAWESSRHSQKTWAYLDYPMLIVSRGLNHLFARAMQVLQEHEDRPVFPVEHFRAAALRAVLLGRSGQSEAARDFARAALAAASEQKSGFRYHQNVGLVSAADRELVEQVAAMLGNELN